MGRAKINKFLIVIIAIQILLLMNLPTAQSYQIKEMNESDNTAAIGKNQNIFLKEVGTALLSLLSIKQIGTVSAVGEEFAWTKNYTTTNYAKAENTINKDSWFCCPQTTEGALCQNSPIPDGKKCALNYIPLSCEEVEECKLGCCVDPEEGLCTTQSTKFACENQGGDWRDDADCLVDVCEKGCCVVDSKTSFITEQRCEMVAAAKGYETDFRQYNTELDCLALEEILIQGACLLSDNICKFTTITECENMDGDFRPEKLCSNENLNMNCTKQSYIGCEQGEDQIFWFDSCGNKENIYNADKEKSWNDGKILYEYQSCQLNPSNIEECGNCNRFRGTFCKEDAEEKVEDGDFFCQSLNCIEEDGKERQNGESWCVYDSFIGDGKDLPGSRHWRRECINGEIRVDPCGDYRGQICTEITIKSLDTNRTTTDAKCVLNEAMKCIQYNNKIDKNFLCAQNSHCKLTKIDIDEGFRFDMCTPAYPRGFDLKYENAAASKQLCEIGNQECVVMYEKKVTGWECMMNCDCEDAVFAEQLNDMCISLGDCGAHVNIEGRGTNSYTVQETEKTSWKRYEVLKDPVEGQFVTVNNKTELKDQIMGTEAPEQYDQDALGREVVSTIQFTGQMASSAITLVTFTGQILSAGSLVSVMKSVFTPTVYPSVFSPPVAPSPIFSPTPTPIYGVSGISTPAPTINLDGGTISFVTETSQASYITQLFGDTTGSVISSIIQAVGPWLQMFGTALTGLSLGMMVAQYFNQWFGMNGDAALAVTITGAVTGLAVGTVLGIALYGATAIGTISTAAGASVASAIGSASAVGATAAGAAGGLGGFIGGIGASVAGSVGLSASAGIIGPALAGAAVMGVIGIIVIVIVILIILVMILFMKLLEIGETREVHVKFNCHPWQAPSGGNDCSKCNDDLLKPCTEYKCMSLGRACGLVNPISQNPTCEQLYADTGLEPVIISVEDYGALSIKNDSRKDYTVRLNDESCFYPNSPVAVTFETDKEVQCKFDTKQTDSFEDMANFVLEGNMFTINHTIAYMAPNLNSLQVYNITADAMGMMASSDLYVRCNDVYDRENVNEYKFNFCVKTEPDKIPPIAFNIVPIPNAVIRNGVTEVPLEIYLNEPANCRYDVLDEDYELMDNEMDCETKMDAVDKYGWKCSTTLTGMNKTENSVYLRCKDQPWIDVARNKGIDVSSNHTRNANNISLNYTLFKSVSELEIIEIGPTGEHDFGFSPISMDLYVKTAGGFDGAGNARCDYSFRGFDDAMISMRHTYSNKHRQTFSALMAENYKLYVECRDDAGNIARKTTEFKLKIDDRAPQVIRTFIEYKKNIKMTTNEKSRCYYSLDDCNFDRKNATEIGSMGFDHTIYDAVTVLDYYVKCEDSFGNVNPSCAIVVSKASLQGGYS